MRTMDHSLLVGRQLPPWPYISQCRDRPIQLSELPMPRYALLPTGPILHLHLQKESCIALK